MDNADKKNGPAKGGLARAKSLSPTERRAIAKKAAEARWGVGVYTESYKGNFENDFGIDVDCYVLDDPLKTAVISQRGMAAAIGLNRRGNALKSFIDSQQMSRYIGGELRAKIEKPLIFQRSGSAAANPISAQTHGYDVTILIDILNAIINASADGKLSAERYSKMIEHAQIITSAAAKSGIKHLVYALSGYNPTADEVIEAFKLYVREEAKKYEKEFPVELYEQWHRLYQIPVLERGKPWHFKHLTIKHIYVPLAQSNGKILELMRALKSRDGDRQKKLFQFLNEMGARALRIHIGRVLEMCESSTNMKEYEAKIIDRFGGQTEFDFVMPDPPTA